MTAPWYHGLSRLHWLVLTLACLGWLFDTMDQRLFILIRQHAMRELLPSDTSPEQLTAAGSTATALFMTGWATGGLLFGLLGDWIGRARTMGLTILIYSIFTGLSALSVGFWDFCLYRFLAGLGVGGEFAAGVALVAEVMPQRARTHALGLLQVMAILGTLIGTLLSLLVPPAQMLLGWAGWRWLFLLGALPAVLVVFLRRGLSEPEQWTQAQAEPRPNLVVELFTDPRWRHHLFIGTMLSTAGIIGIWAAGLWTPELIRGVVRDTQPSVNAGPIVASGLLLKDVAAALGIWVFTLFAAHWGRRPAFAVFQLAAWISIVVTFVALRTVNDVYWLMPLLGFFAWGLLGGYAIYFPELFPTRLRSTGTGFCYNGARYLTAFGLVGLGQLVVWYQGAGWAEPLRPAAITVASVYLVGLLVLLLAPETRDQPLPE